MDEQIKARFDSPSGRAAVQLFEAGRAEAAELQALETLLFEPGDVLAMDVLVRRYLARARYAECATLLARLLRFLPDNAAGWNNLGCCRAELRQFDAAREAFERATDADAGYLAAYAGLAATRYALGDADGAELAYRAILSRRPDDLDAQVNLVNCLLAQEQGAQALEAMALPASRLLPRKAAPSHAAPGHAANARTGPAGSNRQAVAQPPDAAGPDDSPQTLRPAPRPAPDLPWRGRIDNQPIFESAHARLGMALITTGRTAEGLALMERRLASAFIPGLDARRCADLWRGEPLAGKRLLLLWEQGYGDAFQALRHVEWLAREARQVVLPADEACRQLFADSFAHLGDRVRLIDWREAPADFDLYVSLLSLHERAQRRGIAQPFAARAYLHADAQRVARLARLKVDERALAIGVIWAGRPDLMLDAQRSLNADTLAALVRPIRGVRFYGLQVGPAALECTRLVAHGVVDWSGPLDSFADTAAALRALDAVVCVDTAGLHLAGALGVRAFLLNRFGSEFRWGLGRDDGVWYDSVTQVRQTIRGDWGPAIERLRDELGRLAADRAMDAVVPSPQGTSPRRSGTRLDAASLLDVDVDFSPQRMADIEAALGRRDITEARAAIDACRTEQGDSPRLMCHAGVLEVFAGDNPAARGHFDRAVTARPDYAVAFGNRASAREADDAQGREDDLLRSVAFDAGFAAGWANLARHERGRGRHAQAHRHARRAQALAPADPAMRLLRGECALDAGELDDALAQFEALRDAAPDRAESWANLLPVLGMMDRRGEAQAALARALAIDATHDGALNNGVQHGLRSQQYDQALELADRHVAAAPQRAAPHVMRALVLHHLKRHDEALASLGRGLAIEPENLEGLFALGTVLERVDRLDESEAALRRALALRRDYRSLVNLAVTLNRQQRYDEARRLNDEALGSAGDRLAAERDRKMASARAELAKAPFRAELQTVDLAFGPDWNNALLDLVQGDLRRGFAGYELRLAHQAIAGLDEDTQRRTRWRGESLSGRRLLLLPEQGFGDVIQFMRYLPRVKALGAWTMVGASGPLERLLRASPHVDEVVPLGDGQRPAFDLWSPIMSLAHRLDVRTPADFAPAFPYVQVPGEARMRWRARIDSLCARPSGRVPSSAGAARLGGAGAASAASAASPGPSGVSGGLTIGVVWAGRKIYPADRLRSIDLRELRLAIEREGCRYVSLQVGDSAAESADWPDLIDLSGELADFAETAAAIEQLDLVVTVDTAICHLAGALGKPVWMLNRVSTDWRWGPTGERCGWYPSLRMFRQKRMLSWTEPLADMGAALDVLLADAGRMQPAAVVRSPVERMAA